MSTRNIIIAVVAVVVVVVIGYFMLTPERGAEAPETATQDETEPAQDEADTTESGN